jgi:hypothetical protein
MVYDASEQTERAEQAVDNAISVYRDERLDMTSFERDEYWRSVAAFSFLCCGTSFKNPKFVHQREWRIFLSRPSECPDVLALGPHGRRYMRWPFPTGVVNGIIKGAHCDFPDPDLKYLLRAAGHPANVLGAPVIEQTTGKS